MAARVPARLTAVQGRRFAFPVGGAFLALGSVLFWRGRHSLGSVLGGIGIVLLLAGVAVPERLGPVERTWMAFAARISRVTTPLLMAAVFFLVMTPIGVVLRAVGHRPLARQPEAGGFWARREDGSRRSNLERQF